jgi:hypothetical protein
MPKKCSAFYPIPQSTNTITRHPHLLNASARFANREAKPSQTAMNNG